MKIHFPENKKYLLKLFNLLGASENLFKALLKLLKPLK